MIGFKKVSDPLGNLFRVVLGCFPLCVTVIDFERGCIVFKIRF